MDINVHDLVKINGAQALETSEPLPAWAIFSLKKAPYVVVRRAEIVNKKIPVGIRGENRAERMAAWVDEENAEKVIPPEEIIHQKMWKELEGNRRVLPQIEAMLALDKLLRRERLAWGPGGSTGFELVSKMNTINMHSDVDIIIRVDEQNIKKMETLREKIQNLSARVDVLLEAEIGAIALEDYLGKHSKMLVRTKNGPRLFDREKVF
ncbi:malonate decarboxylase holo-ACP synthase [Marinococcus halophilus]|uniref:Phosphoribosyl-dephospho-CoA transferase n=1 Tax=Marinococcus halophilus TaxID=1371 RepID=A0A510Y914_MARHA|nr:malonate decarboxylase holo-ACP synthase [Marinococcus halophilus]OZT79176.1 malonate decarboxylase holo-ACP synthase [Marinococcus halophilus]GEK59839.1 phosphoribosyl-dephospho-CoA transferase [Marinococcus halophilus]